MRGSTVLLWVGEPAMTAPQSADNMAAQLTYMKGLRPLNRIGGAFGSYGWSGEGPKFLHEQLASMPVQNWMTTDVVSVGPETSLLKVGKLMKDHHIRRIPVVDEQGQVIGIISDRDVRDASPSKATTLDMYEMHYLLAELKAKNIMTAKPITVKPTDTVEQAALIMTFLLCNSLKHINNSD